MYFFALCVPHPGGAERYTLNLAKELLPQRRRFTDCNTEGTAAEREALSLNGAWIDIYGKLRIRLLDSNGNVRGQTYTLEITGDFPKDAGVCLGTSDYDYYLDGALLEDRTPIAADLAFYVLSPIYPWCGCCFWHSRRGFWLRLPLCVFVPMCSV